MAAQSWAAALIDVVIFGVVYGYRMFVEERVLINELGNSYVEYMKRTKRVIPYRSVEPEWADIIIIL